MSEVEEAAHEALARALGLRDEEAPGILVLIDELRADRDEQRRLKEAALEHLAARTKQCQGLRLAMERIASDALAAVDLSLPKG